VSAETDENAVFSLALPNRSLSYTKISPGERRDKRKRSFQFGFAEPQPILYKDTAKSVLPQKKRQFYSSLQKDTTLTICTITSVASL